jgi:hypothetical protein
VNLLRFEYAIFTLQHFIVGLGRGSCGPLKPSLSLCTWPHNAKLIQLFAIFTLDVINHFSAKHNLCSAIPVSLHHQHCVLHPPRVELSFKYDKPGVGSILEFMSHHNSVQLFALQKLPLETRQLCYKFAMDDRTVLMIGNEDNVYDSLPGLCHDLRSLSKDVLPVPR